MPRAVILSGALGSGHDVVSQVVGDGLGRHGWDVRTLDCMALLGSAGAKVGDRVFRQITTMPGLYDGLHFADFRRGGPMVRFIDREATRRLVPAVKTELDRSPAELLVATFATGASVAAKLRPALPEHKTIVLCTDVDVYWLWVWEEVDLFLVTSQAAAGSVRRYLPRAQVQLVPPLVRPEFYRAPDQESARRTLGVPLDAPCVLIMGGGWGMGPIEDAARALGADGVHVLAVAGRNERLVRRLDALQIDGGQIDGGRSATLHPFGFTDRIPELMSAADVVVTTPGATTCGEARVVGRHLVIIDSLPGHGRENLQHELEQGDADACGPTGAEVHATVSAVLEQVKRPLPTVVRPAGEWNDAFSTALESIGLND